MNDEPEIWELRHADVVIGKLTITDQDMFWFHSRFEATPEFEPYRDLFAESSHFAADVEDQVWDAWYEKIQNLGLHLIRLRDSAVASEFILYIDGDQSSFRPRFDA